MSEEEEKVGFACREMLFAGLLWLIPKVSYLVICSKVPDSYEEARGSARLAGQSINPFDPETNPFVGPGYSYPDEAAEHPLKKGDVLLYIKGMEDMRGTKDGNAVCVCLLSDIEVLYISPCEGEVFIDYPVILDPWCITNLQPEEGCEITEAFEQYG